MLRFRHSAAFGGNTTITVSFLIANSQPNSTSSHVTLLNSSVFIYDENIPNELGLMYSPTYSLPLSQTRNTHTQCYFLCYFGAVLWISGGKKRPMFSVILGCTCSADACLCIPPLIFSVFIYLTEQEECEVCSLVVLGGGREWADE